MSTDMKTTLNQMVNRLKSNLLLTFDIKYGRKYGLLQKTILSGPVAMGTLFTQRSGADQL
jgi:hypothetical protein